MTVVDDFRLKLGDSEFVPIIIGGMGVDISTTELACVASRLGGIGHISDAMSQQVSDKKYGTKFTQIKARKYKDVQKSFDKTSVKFDHDDLRRSQINHVEDTMNRKQGPGAIHINVMEKLQMGDPIGTLQTRLNAALDGGIDGITLSAGLHNHSLRLMVDNPRFRDANIGIIVSSVRALRIFLRGASRVDRLPDYIVVEGPLAGGHLGFGEDWKKFQLATIVAEVIQFLKEKDLAIPVIPAGGVFTGSDALNFLEMGASAVQVATRFTVTRECGLPENVKQEYFKAEEKDVVVTTVSPTGYPLRLLTSSPALRSNVRPSCEGFGYILDGKGECAYVDAYQAGGCDEKGRKLPIEEKVCLCYHFSKYNCWTCGHYVYRLKDTSVQEADGNFRLLDAEHVFKDYQHSSEHQIAQPEPAAKTDAEDKELAVG